MLTAILRSIDEMDRVSVTLHNVDGMPLYSTVKSEYSNLEEAKAALEPLGLQWQAPSEWADQSVLAVGKP